MSQARDNTDDDRRTKDDDRNVDRAQYSQFVCFLKQTILALQRKAKAVSIYVLPINTRDAKPSPRKNSSSVAGGFRLANASCTATLTFKKVTARFRSCCRKGIISMLSGLTVFDNCA